jgi:hypothetical protein
METIQKIVFHKDHHYAEVVSGCGVVEVDLCRYSFWKWNSIFTPVSSMPAVSEFGHWKARLAFELVSALLVLVSNFNPEERQFRHFQLEDSFLVPVGNPRILHRSRLPLGNIRRHSCNQHLQVKNNQANSPISLNLLEKISCRPCTRRKHKAGSIIPW